MNRTAIILLALLSVTSSCNILEDRGSCPCLITVRTEEVPMGADSVCLYLLKDSTPELKVRLGEDEITQEGYTVRTERRRRDLTAALWCDTSGFRYPDFNVSGSLITGKEGQDFPAVFMGKAVLYAEHDTAEARVTMHKRYAGITVTLLRETVPESVSITYGNGGYTLDGLPSGGRRTYSPGFSYRERHLSFSFRVPAQSDGLLDICIKGTNGSSTVIRLGEILARKGYDWSSEDLMDIEMTIVGNEAEPAVDAEPWTEHPYDITI